MSASYNLMSLNAVSPQEVAISRKSAFQTPGLTTPLTQCKGLKENHEANISVGARKDGELSGVATVIARDVLSASSILDDSQKEAEALHSKALRTFMKLNGWRCSGRNLDGNP
jgi:hypothetical protein